MPPLPDMLRRLAALPGLAAAKAPGPVALQLTLGAVCVLGSVAWVTGSLLSFAEPPPAKVLFSRLDDWPEIKNGVPDLKRPALVPAPGIDVSPRPPEARHASEPEVPPTNPSAAPSPAWSTVTRVQETSRFEPSSPSLPAIPTTHAVNGEPVAEAPAPDLSGAGASAADGVASSLPSPPRTAASVEAGTRARRGETAALPRPNRGGERTNADAQPRPSASQRNAGATRKAEAKPRPERKRVAAAPPEMSDEPAAPSGPAETDIKAPAVDEPVQVLGMSLPSGRKIKECLLELRC